MIKITNIKIYENLNQDELLEQIVSKYNIDKNDILSWHIIKKSIDARRKNDIHFNYSICLEVKSDSKYKRFEKIDYFPKNLSLKLDNYVDTKDCFLPPVIIGAGPAGLFAALSLIENGICPIIIEQGKSVEERKKDVDNFLNGGKLDYFSNVQFGEGGAGTFSDGKLTTGINNSLCQKVLYEFVRFGAPEDIMYIAKPHIGTDKLIGIIKKMRQYIISKGGKFLFSTKAIDFDIKNNRIEAVIIKKLNKENNNISEIKTNQLILAIGHSSRDTFYKIFEKGLILEPKNFSVGVRIEHLQHDINIAQYGTLTKLKLPPADYKLAYHLSSGRSCYTFCMCPGGTVIASSSDKNTIVTNGMSNYLRDGLNANAAVLVNVTPDDFKNNSPLAGIDFQKRLEEKAFTLGGSNYHAPIQRFEDFLKNQKTTGLGNIKPSYKPGYTFSNLNDILPDFVNSTLKEGILYFDNKIKGFAHPDSILTGVETRSSSPVKILRNDNCVSNIEGIYPCGEGAGYAGGIMSAAVDGIKCAYNILKNFD